MTPAPEPTAGKLREKADQLVAGYRAAAKNAGVVVGVLAGGEQHVFAYGRTAQDGPPPDERTMFEIGSITKVFTANLLADMVQRGEVRLDDPVRKYLPESVRVPTYGGQEITLFHLATHTSSLPRLPGNLDQHVQDEANPYAHYTAEHLYEYLGACRLRRPVGTQEEYSNLGMGLLGHVLSRAAGKPYEELVVERVCQPLGLHDTRITLTEDQKNRLAPGHAASGAAVSNWDFVVAAGAGALRSTVADMLTYLAANLRPETTPIGPALEACHVVYPLKRTPWSVAKPYLTAAVLVGLGLLFQWLFGWTPKTYLFYAATMIPVVLSGYLGGRGPGLAAATLTVLGCRLLWGERFDWMAGVVATGLLAAGSSFHHWFATREVLLGWQATGLGKGVRMLWHNGGTGGYRSFCGFVRASQTAVVVLANSEHVIDDIGSGLLEHLHRASV